MPPKSAKPSPAALLEAVRAGDLAGVQDLLAAGAKPDKREAGMETPLIAAVIKGHAEIARALLKAGANPSLKFGRRGKTTALLEAIRSQQFELACELVAAGADVHFDWSGEGTNMTHDAIETCNTLCREANAPLPQNLMGVIHKGKGPEAQARARKMFPASLKLVQTLLEAGGRPGKPILPSCAGSGNLPVQRLLLAHGINVNEEERYAGSAFHYAISQCQIEAALELLKAGADANMGDTIMGPPFHRAVVAGLTDIIKGIIAAGANLNFRGTVTLKEKEEKPEPESQSGRPRFRLNMGPDFVPNKQARDSTPLIVAVRARQAEIVRLLVEAKADLEGVDADGFTAFAWAETLGLGDVAALLRSAGALEKRPGEGSPFHVLFNACQSGDLARTNEALAAGADVNAAKQVTRGAMTPLMAAARHGHVAIVEALLQAGANPDLAGLEELAMLVSPLMLAARHGHLEVVKRLLEAGASADAPGRQLFALREEGDAAIHEAARNGHPKVVELLLQSGVKKNSRSEWSGSVLAAAVQGGNLETVKVMLAAGAKPTVKNLANLLAIAKGPQQADIVRELQAAGQTLD